MGHLKRTSPRSTPLMGLVFITIWGCSRILPLSPSYSLAPPSGVRAGDGVSVPGSRTVKNADLLDQTRGTNYTLGCPLTCSLPLPLVSVPTLRSLTSFHLQCGPVTSGERQWMRLVTVELLFVENHKGSS